MNSHREADVIEGEVTMGAAVAVIEAGGMIRTDVKGALAAWEDYQTLTRELLNESDYQDAGGGKRFKKKSAWRKYANAFRISDRVTYEEIKRDERGRPIWVRVRVEAYHSGTGRKAEAGHECHILERCCPASDGEACPKVSWTKHTCCPMNCLGHLHWSHPGDVTETALTRAKNRAISDLIGAGEVSAEEMTPEMVTRDEPRPATRPLSAAPSPTPQRSAPVAQRQVAAPKCPQHGGVMKFWPEEARRDDPSKVTSARWKCTERGCKDAKGYPETVWAQDWTDYLSQKAQSAQPADVGDLDEGLPFE